MSAWIRSVTGHAYQSRLHSSKHQSGHVLSVRLLDATGRIGIFRTDLPELLHHAADSG